MGDKTPDNLGDWAIQCASLAQESLLRGEQDKAVEFLLTALGHLGVVATPAGAPAVDSDLRRDGLNILDGITADLKAHAEAMRLNAIKGVNADDLDRWADELDESYLKLVAAGDKPAPAAGQYNPPYQHGPGTGIVRDKDGQVVCATYGCQEKVDLIVMALNALLATAPAPAAGALVQKVRDHFATVSDEEFFRGVKEAGFELRPAPAAGAEPDELAQMRKERDACAADAREWRYRARQYREQLNTKESLGSVLGSEFVAAHYWMPNEDNHLESLSCPVVIPAEWLRNLLEEAKAGAEPGDVLRLRIKEALRDELMHPYAERNEMAAYRAIERAMSVVDKVFAAIAQGGADRG